MLFRQIDMACFPVPGARLINDRCNYIRLHSAIGYVTPNDLLAGRQVEIHTERDRKLEVASQQRQSRRQQAALRAKWPAAAMSDSHE